MKATQCTSSATFLEMSDFPLPKEYGSFPHHTDVLEYLRSYAMEFNILPHIKFNTAVVDVEKKGGAWRVSCYTGNVYTSKFLIVAAGLDQIPNRQLKDTVLSKFTGKILHSCEIKEPLEDFRNIRLLLLGGGESSSDICLDWIDHTACIYWSIPRGQHFFRKYGKILPWMKAQPLDHVSSRMTNAISPFVCSKPGISWMCKWTTNGSLLAYQGHGIPEWKNKSEFFKCFVNKNGKVLDLIDYKRLIPKGAILKCKDREVTFIDGTTQEFDLVIMSTGYTREYPYLPARYHVGIRERYKMVFDVEDPSLAFVGLVRPIVGSLVGISELQARWVAKVFSSKVPLKPLDERKRDVLHNIVYLSEHFKDSSQIIEGLVEVYSYTDDIARQAEIYPNYWSLFKKSPRQWFVAYFSPYNSAMYRLNESEKVEQSIKTMSSHQKTMILPFPYLLALLLRLIWFDWWLNKISEVKFRIQTSSWWPTVREWRVIKAANYLWTLPKKICFDNTSDAVNEMSSHAKQLMHTRKCQ